MLLKICGITRADDARHAVEHGATALGFVFWAGSPRYIPPDEAAAIVAAVPLMVTTVGVFVNAPIEEIRDVVGRTGVGMVQLHGDEPASYAGALDRPVLRSATVATAPEICRAWPPDTTLLLDAADPLRRGGTGRRVDWAAAAALARRRSVVLAGGLTPSNVAQAVAAVRPIGVDVSSGVEAAPGIKSADRVSAFLLSARAAFERL